jgi:hypothetical protein
LAVGRGREYQDPKQADRQKISRDYDLDWQSFVSTTHTKIAYSANIFFGAFLGWIGNPLKRNISYVKLLFLNKLNNTAMSQRGMRGS